MHFLWWYKFYQNHSGFFIKFREIPDSRFRFLLLWIWKGFLYKSTILVGKFRFKFWWKFDFQQELGINVNFQMDDFKERNIQEKIPKRYFTEEVTIAQCNAELLYAFKSFIVL